jgi:hypothetical protein
MSGEQLYLLELLRLLSPGNCSIAAKPQTRMTSTEIRTAKPQTWTHGLRPSNRDFWAKNTTRLMGLAISCWGLVVLLHFTSVCDRYQRIAPLLNTRSRDFSC